MTHSDPQLTAQLRESIAIEREKNLSEGMALIRKAGIHTDAEFLRVLENAIASCFESWRDPDWNDMREKLIDRCCDFEDAIGAERRFADCPTYSVRQYSGKGRR